MGIKCSNTAEVYFEDVKIPKENLLGGKDHYGSKVYILWQIKTIVNRIAILVKDSGTLRNLCVLQRKEKDLKWQ